MEYSGEEFRMWCEERDRAILSGDVKKFRAFYERWRDKGMYDKPLPADDRIVDCAIHKMVLSLSSITEEEREAAKRWLMENGYGVD